MDVAVFSTKPYDRRFLDAAVAGRHALTYIDARLDPTTAILAGKAKVVCAFVNDAVDAAALDTFAELGVRLVVLRSAGFNNVDLAAAKRHDILVARVPAYSPEAVSEHAVALMLSLDRHIHRAYARGAGRELRPRTVCSGSICTAERWESWGPAGSARASPGSCWASGAR